MTPTLPSNRESVASACAGSLWQGPRPILVVEKSYSRAGELLGSIQRLGLPCVVALDPLMFEHWHESMRPGAVVLNLEAGWTWEVGDVLIEEGMYVVALSDKHEDRLAAIERGYSEVVQASVSLDEIAARLFSRIGSGDDGSGASAETSPSGPLRVDVARRMRS